MSTRSKPPTAQSRRLSLPKPSGLRGHLKYTWAALGLMSDFRRQLKFFDLRLKDSVIRRDRALEALGRAALELADKHGADRIWEGITPFQDTLKALEIEHTDIEKRNALMHVALKSTEDEGRRTLEQLEERRTSVRADYDPQLAAVSELRVRQQTLSTELRDLKRRQEQVRDQLEFMRGQIERGEGDIDELRKVTQGLDAQLIEIDRDVSQKGAEEVALETQLEAEQSRAQALKSQIATLDNEERERRAQVETRLAELRATMQESTRKAEKLEERRRAVHVDLGREITLLPKPIASLKAQTSQAILAGQTCNQITAARTSVLSQWELLDGAPIRRTVTWIVLAVFALIIAAIVW
ncbi:MAG: hypothetical protein ACE366_09170 [Bradymonadia bacterium]